MGLHDDQSTRANILYLAHIDTLHDSHGTDEEEVLPDSIRQIEDRGNPLILGEREELHDRLSLRRSLHFWDLIGRETKDSTRIREEKKDIMILRREDTRDLIFILYGCSDPLSSSSLSPEAR